MKTIFSLLLISLLLSCDRAPKPFPLEKLTGYWEIEKVVFAEGEEKLYKINETIDYIYVKDSAGFRKKVMPQFNGTYLENGDLETVKVRGKDGRTFLDYQTPYTKRSEEISELTTDKLVVKLDGAEYHYKKPIPFSVK